MAIIAQAARYHRKGMPEPGADGGAVRRRRRASAWIAARCCCAWPRISSARATSSCAAPSIALSDGEVELRLIADGESAVPRWAAGRERELFARAFHRELSVAA